MRGLATLSGTRQEMHHLRADQRDEMAIELVPFQSLNLPMTQSQSVLAGEIL